MKPAERLDRLIKKIPEVECQGKCWQACGLIGPQSLPEVQAVARFCEQNGIEFKKFESGFEGHRIEESLKHLNEGDETSLPECLKCPYLTEDRKCRIYPARPVICRLWGAISELPCEYGCRVSRKLSRKEEAALVSEALALRRLYRTGSPQVTS